MSNQPIELETADIDHHIEMGECLQRLKQNPDFQKLIMDGYLKEKALASVSLLGVPQERDQRGSVLEDLVSTSNLGYWFMMIENFYEGAKNPTLSDDEEQELADAEVEGGVQ
jgi:hypothetical protein